MYASTVAPARDGDVGGVGGVGRGANHGNTRGGTRGGSDLRMRRLN